MKKTIIILLLLISSYMIPALILKQKNNTSLTNESTRINTLNKPLIMYNNETNTLLFNKVIDGITKELIINATYEAIITNLNNNTSLNITNNLINHENGSYELIIPQLEEGNYLIRINWYFNNKTTITTYPILIK